MSGTPCSKAPCLSAASVYPLYWLFNHLIPPSSYPSLSNEIWLLSRSLSWSSSLSSLHFSLTSWFSDTRGLAPGETGNSTRAAPLSLTASSTPGAYQALSNAHWAKEGFWWQDIKMWRPQTHAEETLEIIYFKYSILQQREKMQRLDSTVTAEPPRVEVPCCSHQVSLTDKGYVPDTLRISISSLPPPPVTYPFREPEANNRIGLRAHQVTSQGGRRAAS